MSGLRTAWLFTRDFLFMPLCCPLISSHPAWNASAYRRSEPCTTGDNNFSLHQVRRESRRSRRYQFSDSYFNWNLGISPRTKLMKQKSRLYYDDAMSDDVKIVRLIRVTITERTILLDTNLKIILLDRENEGRTMLQSICLYFNNYIKFLILNYIQFESFQSRSFVFILLALI